MDNKKIIAISAAIAITAAATEALLLQLSSCNIATVAIAAAIAVVGTLAIYFAIKKNTERSIAEMYLAGQPGKKTVEKEKEQDKEKEKEKTDVTLDTIIAEVNEDVAKWAKDRTHEIAILKANDKYRKEFLGNVSHELKTPLFNIQGYINTLIDNGLEDQDINMKYLDRAEKNVSRLIKIVEDLSTISKFESGALKLNIENFDIKKSVEDVFDFYEIKAKTKNITLQLASAPEKPSVCVGDKEKIYEVLSNLVVNSINYGKENGKTTIGIYDIGTKYLIEVQDNGIGIDESHLQRVFERFFRVDKSRSSQNGGTGLGLSIVKHIIEAHGELITVKSKINEGTTFSFTLKKAE